MNAKKIFLWSGISAVIIGLAVAAFLWLRHPQTIVLKDGTKLTLAGITYGKRHSFPGKQPYPYARANQPLTSSNNTLVVWIQQEHKPNSWPNYDVLLYDQASTACVRRSSTSYGNRRQGQTVDTLGVQFAAFPRRGGNFFVRILELDRRTGQTTNSGQFVISNPARGPFEKWSPTPLPDTQTDGDLSVTLNRLVFGVEGPYVRPGDDKKDPAHRGVQAFLHIEQNGVAVTNWQPVQVETWDGTGNHVIGQCTSQWDVDGLATTYKYGLWPDEPAWKVRLEFSRNSDFHDDEIWTVHDLPVEPGQQQDLWDFGPRTRPSTSFADTAINGINLKIYAAKHFTDEPESMSDGGFVIQTSQPLDGLRLNLLKITDEQGHEIQTWNFGGSSTRHAFGLRGFGDAKKINVTLALHRSRYVEFTAQPEKR